MKTEYIRVAAATPDIRVADCAYNITQIQELIKKSHAKQIHLLCLPELCITGYTCGDLFLQDALVNCAWDALLTLIENTKNYNVLTIAGLPYKHSGKLYNVAAVFCRGELLQIVPKATSDYDVLFGADVMFTTLDMPDFKLAIQIGENTDNIPAGATIIANPSAIPQTVGLSGYKKSRIKSNSARFICGYIHANAGHGESTTDIVFAGHNIICENGHLLDESPPFSESENEGLVVTEIDLAAIAYDQRRANTAQQAQQTQQLQQLHQNTELRYAKLDINVDMSSENNNESKSENMNESKSENNSENKGISLSRFIDPYPFIPSDPQKLNTRCEEILNIQAHGLKKRLAHIVSKTAVIGISGGLDSSLALLATARAIKLLGKSPSYILAVTMPCFGTTDRTKNNAYKLCEALGVTLQEIDITESVVHHLNDIGHSKDSKDTVYENAQARMRTMILMNLANQNDGIVIGTGDLSELALGWSTYNGDHMSMYGINSGVPKTLVRHLIKYSADVAGNKELSSVLMDILGTPVSPELLPEPQHTEDIIGPYELHDFFLYHMIRRGRTPSAIFFLAGLAFKGRYDYGEIKKWMIVFYRRFFAQQFKRSCLPDGPRIGSVCLSPRGGWSMPSDASSAAWMAELEDLEV